MQIIQRRKRLLGSGAVDHLGYDVALTSFNQATDIAATTRCGDCDRSVAPLFEQESLYCGEDEQHFEQRKKKKW